MGLAPPQDLERRPFVVPGVDGPGFRPILYSLAQAWGLTRPNHGEMTDQRAAVAARRSQCA